MVIHATVEPTLEGSILILRERGLSYHYIVDRDGSAIQCVSPQDVAFHAGQSTGPQGAGVNEYSLGISLVNLNDGVDPFPPEQLSQLESLVTRLKKAFPSLRFIASHASISPGRKSDPAGFPLASFAETVGLSLWL